MLEIDGSAGGGQLLRSSLALAAVTDESVTVTNIRGSRPEPGLKSQHLTAVEILADVCDATVEGASRGSETVTFEPGAPRGGQFEASVNTAGSLTLIFDALLALGVALDELLSVTVTGGTAVKWSPPLVTYRQVKLPLLRDLGLSAAVEPHRPGYYPAGGGRATLHVGPSSLSPLALTERGEGVGARVYAQASQDLAEAEVTERLADTATTQLEAAGIDVLERQERTATADSTGALLTVELVYENSRAGFDALGEPGKPAKKVATDAIEQALAFDSGAGTVDRHLADQLLVVLALAGGRVSIPERTAHVETSLDLLDAFGVDCSVEAVEDGSLIVERQ